MRKIILALLLCFLFQFTEAQAPLKGRDSTVKGPQTFAMVMGISKYKYVRPLAYADKDAQLFKDYLRSPGGGSVKEDNIYMLLNEKANNSNFWGKGFQWLKAKKLQRGDRLFIYLAGHGDAIDEDQFFFLGYDCNPQGDKNNYLVAGTIQLFNLKKKIANETSKGVEVFFIMDACRSNELPGGQAGLNFLNSAISEKKAGEIIMLATAAGESSLEDASIGTGHGLFTYYLVDGLNGVADTIGGADRKVTFREIQAYVDKNVPFVAQQRFKSKQDPYFCCNESGDKVISLVDSVYLKNWIKQKKQQNRGGGNSFNGLERSFDAADTLLIQTYNRFNTAVKNNRLTGSSSAEEYFQQLNKKFPGNPYTLDAKSTLAVEFIDVAQAKVDRYLACGDDNSAKEKQDNYQAALNLEKAIASVREDDEDFARSLMNRMYFLKASGDLGTNGTNGNIPIAFQNAYAAMKIDPNGAYIQNRLALLHLQNNNKDSALYYANKAVKTAPGWPCALATLTLIQKNTTSNPDEPKKQPAKKSPFRKISFGATLGGGLNQSDPTYSGNANSGFTSVASNSAVVGNLGLICQVNIAGNIFIRPEAGVTFENTSVEFRRVRATGQDSIIETLDVKGAVANIALPILIRFSSKNTAVYISLGPSFNYLLSQNSESAEKLPINKSIFLGSGALGVDIGLTKSGFVISPEIRYTAGFSEMKDDASTTSYSRALSSLKKNTFSLNVYLRKR